MTKTLTEQWREGTLPDGYYYIDYDTQQRIFEIEDGCATYQGLPAETYFLNDVCLIKVLAPVPSYQTWKEFQQHFVDSLELEVKLKKTYEELEKQSIEIVGLKTEKEQLVSKTEQLEKRLEIATKALKNAYKFPSTISLKEYCERALKEMEGVK